MKKITSKIMLFLLLFASWSFAEEGNVQLSPTIKGDGNDNGSTSSPKPPADITGVYKYQSNGHVNITQIGSKVTMILRWIDKEGIDEYIVMADRSGNQLAGQWGRIRNNGTSVAPLLKNYTGTIQNNGTITSNTPDFTNITLIRTGNLPHQYNYLNGGYASAMQHSNKVTFVLRWTDMDEYLVRATEVNNLRLVGDWALIKNNGIIVKNPLFRNYVGQINSNDNYSISSGISGTDGMGSVVLRRR